MKILQLHPAGRKTGGGFRTLTRFDVQLTPNVRLYSLELVEAPTGELIVYSPKTRQGRAATFDSEFRGELATAAADALRGARSDATH